MSESKTYQVTVDKVPDYMGTFTSRSPMGAAKKVITTLIKMKKLRKGKVTTKVVVVEKNKNKLFQYKLTHTKLKEPNVVDHGGIIITHKYITEATPL